ncbi:MAG: nucleotidyltransferase [Kiritimatiellae bacterium]|nr:nucleotidyltransferase [Kiritimatiellia bacterium]
MDYEIDHVLEVVTQRLPEAGVDAIMIGGHAVNSYGVLRATQDIDFMIAAAQEDVVRRIMRDTGFTNMAIHETVMFFKRPESTLRIDFLKVDQDTMDKLLANSREVDYFSGHVMRIPQLKDLLAMKIFALVSGGTKREEKDFPDIVNLTMENNLDLEADLHPLCRQFGSEQIFERVSTRIRELTDD